MKIIKQFGKFSTNYIHSRSSASQNQVNYFVNVIFVENAIQTQESRLGGKSFPKQENSREKSHTEMDLNNVKKNHQRSESQSKHPQAITLTSSLILILFGEVYHKSRKFAKGTRLARKTNHFFFFK